MAHWRYGFRWVLMSRENHTGRRFASFAVSSLRWMGPDSLMIGHHRVESVEHVDLDTWILGCWPVERHLQLVMLDEDGTAQETYTLHWDTAESRPFPDSLDYSSTDIALYGVLLRGVWCEAPPTSSGER